MKKDWSTLMMISPLPFVRNVILQYAGPFLFSSQWGEMQHPTWFPSSLTRKGMGNILLDVI